MWWLALFTIRGTIAKHRVPDDFAVLTRGVLPGSHRLVKNDSGYISLVNEGGYPLIDDLSLPGSLSSRSRMPKVVSVTLIRYQPESEVYAAEIEAK